MKDRIDPDYPPPLRLGILHAVTCPARSAIPDCYHGCGSIDHPPVADHKERIDVLVRVTHSDAPARFLDEILGFLPFATVHRHPHLIRSPQNRFPPVPVV